MTTTTDDDSDYPLRENARHAAPNERRHRKIINFSYGGKWLEDDNVYVNSLLQQAHSGRRDYPSSEERAVTGHGPRRRAGATFFVYCRHPYGTSHTRGSLDRFNTRKILYGGTLDKRGLHETRAPIRCRRAVGQGTEFHQRRCQVPPELVADKLS